MQTTIEMKKDKDCKGSVRFAAADPDAPIQTVYVSRKFTNGSFPITLTIATAMEAIARRGGARG
jgi:hypothetical protein